MCCYFSSVCYQVMIMIYYRDFRLLMFFVVHYFQTNKYFYIFVSSFPVKSKFHETKCFDKPTASARAPFSLWLRQPQWVWLRLPPGSLQGGASVVVQDEELLQPQGLLQVGQPSRGEVKVKDGGKEKTKEADAHVKDHAGYIGLAPLLFFLDIFHLFFRVEEKIGISTSQCPSQ